MIINEIRDIVKNYKYEPIEIVEGLNFSQYETLKKIEYYFNSTYLSGQTDKVGRTKPFFNINKAKLNVAVRATDLDTKDISITSDKPASDIKALVFKHEIFQWAKDTRFGVTLNKMGETRAKYGGLIVKKVIKDGQIYIQVPEWQNLITDQVEIGQGVIIERHFMTPVQLKNKLESFNRGVTWDDVKSFLTKNHKRDNLSSIDSFVVYEVHGEFPNNYIDEKEDDNYSQQYHLVLGDVDSQQIVLHAEKEKESPYKYLAWNDIPGRGLGVGVIEDGFQAQQWVNDAILKQRDTMEFASKTLFKSTNKSIGGHITAFAESGDVIDTSEGDVSLLNTTPSSIPSFDNIVNQWTQQYESVASTFASNTGDTQPANTPFRLTLLLNQEANSHFDYRREEMGLFLVEILEDWVLPHISKKLNQEHLLKSDYTPQELKAISRAFVVSQANKKFVKDVIDGKTVTQEDYEAYLGTLEQSVPSQPFLKVPKDYFKDFKAKLSIITTGEQRNKSAQLESIYSIIQLLAGNPALLQDPVLAQLTTKLIEIADIGIAPSSLLESIRQSTAMQEEVNMEAEQINELA